MRLLLSLPIASGSFAIYNMRPCQKSVTPFRFHFLIIAALNHPIITNDEILLKQTFRNTCHFLSESMLTPPKQSTYQQHKLKNTVTWRKNV